jgi:thioredoxin-related protein
MKKFNFLWLDILLFCTLPLLSFCQGVHFETGETWTQLQAKARAENKYIFVDVFATWCGPCKMMDRDVYPNAAVTKAISDQFIAVKLQADQATQDNAEVRSHYAEAKKLLKQYPVQGYPSFLFFDPEGQLIYKDIGYKSVPDFLRLLKLALDPQKIKMLPAMEAYRKGQKDYSLMANLAIYVKDLVGNKALADSIAADYKVNYLDKQPEQALLARENLEWIGQFYKLIHSKDGFFQLCYNKPDIVDQVKNQKGWANSIVNYVVRQEELMDQLVKDGKGNGKKPHWEKLNASINKQYPKLNAHDIVVNFQIDYYRYYALNWKLWAKYINENLVANPPQENGNLFSSAFGRLNLPAWDAFQHCNNKEVLATALSWSDRSIQLDRTDDRMQNLDTRANLLYKLGRTHEAIAQEKAAIELSAAIAKKERKPETKGPFMHDLQTTLAKMEQGKPTW